MSNFNSNNPFRNRLSLSPALPIYQSPQEQPGSSIFDPDIGNPALALDNDISKAPDHPEAPVQKKKPVKRVRLQTPPPLSPDSPESSFSSDDESDDPFESQDANHVYTSANTHDEMPPTEAPPFNPFAKTLQDIERPSKEEEEAPKAPSGRASLDVNAFKRLLLTGYSGLDGQGQASEPAPAVLSPHGQSASGTPALQPPVPDGPNSASTTDASRQSSLFDAPPESPTTTTAHDIEEEGPLAASPAPARKKQPPPAPASRHGKLIKMELGKKEAASKAADDKGSSPAAEDNNGDSGPRLHRSPSDINKPLPPSPIPRALDDSPFDREAAGKLPEPGEKEPHLATLMSTDTPLQVQPQPQPTPAKKPIAPPPRRHGRGESKASIPVISTRQPSGEQAAEDTTPYTVRRSSAESTRSIRSPAPAPPPPRRPNHMSRLSASGIPPVSPSSAIRPGSPAGGIGSQLASPSVASSASPPGSHIHPPAGETASLHSVSTADTPPGTSRASSHPMSPTHASTFPLSPSSGQPSPLAAEKKDLVAAKLSPPPLPPARRPSTRRPASISSFDMGGLPTPRKASREGAPPPPPPPPRARNRGDSRGSEVGVGKRTSLDVKAAVPEEGSAAQVGDSQATYILADLDALQREVDALRGTLGQT